MPEETKEQKQITVLKTTEDGVKVCLGQFEDGVGKGLKYSYPTVPNGAAADQLFGAEETAKLINAIVKLRIAAKVKANKFPRNVDQIEEKAAFGRLAATEQDGVVGLIYGVDEALAFKPGEREVGPRKQIEIELQKAMELMEDGNEMDPMQAVAILQKIKDLRARLKTTPPDNSGE